MKAVVSVYTRFVVKIDEGGDVIQYRHFTSKREQNLTLSSQ